MGEEGKLSKICEPKHGESPRTRRRTVGSIPTSGSDGMAGYHHQSVTQDKAMIFQKKDLFLTLSARERELSMANDQLPMVNRE